MPTRHEKEADRLQLEAALEASIGAGKFAPGRMIPPARALCEEHGVSIHVARQAIRNLEARGLLHTVARVGTFVGAPLRVSAVPQERAHSTGYFALIVNGNERGEIVLPPIHAALCTGFENRIAELSGALLTLSAPQVLERRARGELPELRGVFDVAWHARGPFWVNEFPGSRIPQVRVGGDPRAHGVSDTVSFHDEQGGALATRHLMSEGHTRVAFFGLHGATNDDPLLDWSARREAGWRGALEEAGLASEGFALHPVRPADAIDTHDQMNAAHESVALLVALLEGSARVSAVVVANDFAALGLLSGLRAAHVPDALWPAVVGFDADPTAGRHILTSLRLPWDELGRAGADLLWERAHGLLSSPMQHRDVPMRLIPRLSSRSQWSLRATHTVSNLPTTQTTPQREAIL